MSDDWEPLRNTYFWVHGFGRFLVPLMPRWFRLWLLGPKDARVE